MVLDNLTQAGKVGLACFVAGTCFFLIGFSVSYWVVLNIDEHDIRMGLWELCVSSICFKTTSSSHFNDLPVFGDTSWYKGTQALACLALIALMADFILRILFLYGKQKLFLLISVILDCATAILAFGAAAVFGSEIEDNYRIFRLHFGFAFDIIGGIFFAVSAACFLVEYIRRR
ncbi:uncharacterized protein [Littorina saxatilis]|uniref:Uncharacterized protein n=1 Tax=Littorina saxatilis TaxID=31220 RepID=A0AAN9B9F4_9CAEN